MSRMKKTWILPEEAALMKPYIFENYYEAGTANGFSAQHALSLGANVYTWDITDYNKIWTPEEYEKIKFFLGPFHEGVGAVIQKDQRKTVFLDGNHDFPSLMADWRAIESFMRPGDVLLVHDIKLKPVRLAFRKVCAYEAERNAKSFLIDQYRKTGVVLY